jgi:transcriptional regulator GlxA family with amidase domain
LRSVAVLALEGIAPFELGVLCEVFGVDRSADGLPVYDFALCAPEPGSVRTSVGFELSVEHGLDRLVTADLVAVPAHAEATRCLVPSVPAGGRGVATADIDNAADVPEAALTALREAHARGAMVMSVCSGAFVLGAAGLLDGRRCTTHWRYTDALAAAVPNAKLQPDVLYVEDDNVFTSAGTAAGIDLCLHIVRECSGTAVANSIARRMVVPPHRDGGQAQFIDTPLPEPSGGSLQDLLVWMTQHLDTELSIEDLAARALMSTRTFARRFRAETGTTPHRWLTGQRVLRAQQLLEETDEPIERIAVTCGFGTAAALRHHFVQWRGTTPMAFRRTFRAAG